MNHKRQVIEEKGCSAPAYLVTFSALVTLLMLFFVLLLTLATVQEEGILDKGRYAESRESFLWSIKTLGLGVFTGKKMTPDFGETKIKYFISEPDNDLTVRTINAKEEKTRRIFKKITRTMEAKRSQIVAETNNFSVTNISFSPGESQLNEPSKKFLTQFAANLQQDTGPGEVKLYVLGLARDEQTEKKQWILSARRAQIVADFLNRLLPSQFQCPVYSWGAGPGGLWVTRDSPVSRRSQILITVLRAND